MQKLSCNIILDKNNKEMNLKGSAELPIAIYNDNLKEEPVPYHWHDEVELIVVTSGEMELVCELEKFVLKEGEGIFINSGRLHSCKNYNEKNCVIKSFVFHARFIYGDLTSILFENYFHQFLAETSAQACLLSHEACKFILTSYDAFIEKKFTYEFFVREKLTQALLSIMQSAEYSKSCVDSKTIKQFDRCKKMLSFIHKNFGNEITLLEIAKSAKIKESEALRCFKSTVKTSPINYLKKYRLEQSAILLKTSIEPITAIGFTCGFSEMSYFSKSFKEYYGVTPREYRNSQ